MHLLLFATVSALQYQNDQNVELLVNAISSNLVLKPYDHYLEQFHFCKPAGGPVSQPESLGAILLGDRIFSSKYNIKMRSQEKCQLLCTAKIPSEDTAFIHSAVRDRYILNFIVGEVPVLSHTSELDQIGIPIGFMFQNSTLEFYNHHEFIIEYLPLSDNQATITRVTVRPNSFANQNCQGAPALLLNPAKENLVSFTYSVKWVISDGTRWDHYLNNNDFRVHWFSILNSGMIVALLSAMVGIILIRTLKRDITRYNDVDLEDSHEEFGWKLVHGDVFRAPRHRLLLSVLVGNGIQIALMALSTLGKLRVISGLASLGVVSPASRGSFPTAMITCYILFGFVSGYISSRIYKLLGGQAWKQTVAMNAVLIPGILFVIMLILNFMLIANGSSSAIPIGSILALAALGILVSFPISLVGAYFGFRMPKIKVPVRTNQIPRQVPYQSPYIGIIPSVFLGGLLPFASVFFELFFIMTSIWSNRIYHLFEFLLIVFLITLLTCAIVTILITYFTLCSENHNWMWRSFITGASVSFYIFMYFVMFYFVKLDIRDVSSTVSYFVWAGTGAAMVGVMSGAIGFVSAFVFVRKIYSVIKVD